MIRINLLPVREARKAASLRFQGVLLALSVVAALVVCLALHFSISSAIASEREQMAAARAELAKLEKDRKRVDQFRKEKHDIEAKLAVIHRLEASRTGPVRIMDEIATRIPERLWLGEMSLRGRSLHLKGRSLDNEVVATFMTSLEESPLIERVELKQTRLVEAHGLKLVDFEIESRKTPQK